MDSTLEQVDQTHHPKHEYETGLENINQNEIEPNIDENESQYYQNYEAEQPTQQIQKCETQPNQEILIQEIQDQKTQDQDYDQQKQNILQSQISIKFEIIDLTLSQEQIDYHEKGIKKIKLNNLSQNEVNFEFAQYQRIYLNKFIGNIQESKEFLIQKNENIDDNNDDNNDNEQIQVHSVENESQCSHSNSDENENDLRDQQENSDNEQ